MPLLWLRDGFRFLKASDLESVMVRLIVSVIVFITMCRSSLEPRHINIMSGILSNIELPGDIRRGLAL